jgi:hypothetical protein
VQGFATADIVPLACINYSWYLSWRRKCDE